MAILEFIFKQSEEVQLYIDSNGFNGLKLLEQLIIKATIEGTFEWPVEKNGLSLNLLQKDLDFAELCGPSTSTNQVINLLH